MLKEVLEIEIVPVMKMFPKGNQQSDFKIYAAIPKDENDKRIVLNSTYRTFTLKGKMQELILEATYRAKLEGVEDPKYGFGYNVHEIFRDIPKTLNEQKDFLVSMMTDMQLDAVYKAYPEQDIIELMQTGKFDYNKVYGFGPIVYERIKKKILDNLDWQRLFAELGRYGIKYEMLKKLVDFFGTAENAINRVKENPYELVNLSGVGFKKADAIAQNMGIPQDSPFRIHAGVRHVISEEQNMGHTYIERGELVDKSVEFLGLDSGLIDSNIDSIDGLYIEDSKVALQYLYDCEKYIADRLIEALDCSTELDIDIAKFLEEEQSTMGITLTDQQKSFFYNFKKYNVNFLVGFAGTGKSQLMKLLINLVKRMNQGGGGMLPLRDEDMSLNSIYDKGISPQTTSYKLLSPTGKAAKVLAEYVGDPSASTIHRAIGYGMRKNDAANIELREDVIIVDEVSMLDVQLASVLLRKISNPNVRIVFVGDSAQIPSVNSGNFLKNCVDSKIFPVTELNHVFRQSEGGILDIVSKVRNGQRFIDNDFFGEKLFGSDTVLRSVQQEWMESGYKYYYNQLLEKYQPEDIMVLSATKKGNLGTVAINKSIQDIVNPARDGNKEFKYHEECTFRVGDYVLNTKNTYMINNTEHDCVDIVNGDTGLIVDIISGVTIEDDEEEEDPNGIYIKFDVGVIKIPFENMGQLLHAWCLTKHKSQGSAAKAVLVIMDKSHKFQLNANLAYTGMTRAKEWLGILCQAETLNYAMGKFENMRRRTFLEGLIRMKNKKRDDVIG